MQRGTVSKGDSRPKNDLTAYAGRWVAQLDGRIIGQGGTPEQAIQSAKMARHKEIPHVMYVPTKHPFEFSPELNQVRQVLPPGKRVYLVGGAVRDVMLSRTVHDYDFVLASDALQVARMVANRLRAAYFPLDEERQTARIIFSNDRGERIVMDFSVFRGPDLESDLRARDFTINAMAVDLDQPQALLDPLAGASDLLNKTLRACSSASFQNDPVRILRAIRLAADLDMHLLPETRVMMEKSVAGVAQISPERLRDELFRIFEGPKPHTSIRALEMLKILPYVLPELPYLKGIEQSPPHTKDVWEHTLDTLRNLELLLNVLSQPHDPESASNLILGLAVMQLGRYRKQMADHLKKELIPDRNIRSLLFFSALYHDIAKPQTRDLDGDGRIRFINHENIGSKLISSRAEALHLSNAEMDRLGILVKHHMRPTHLAREKGDPSPRAIYRFFKDAGDAGVDICWLSLADLLATYGVTLPQERWARQVEVVRILLEAWWEQPIEKVNPPNLVTGNDLMVEFDLASGPLIGELLEIVREAQVSGEVSNRKDALEYVRHNLKGRRETSDD